MFVWLLLGWSYLTANFVAAQSASDTDHSESCDVKPETPYEWFDLSHAYISEKLCEPAAAFDRFFGDDRNFENGLGGTYARWRNDFVWTESEKLAFHTGLRARLRLPNFSKRVKLLVSGDYDDEIDSPIGSNPLSNKPSSKTGSADTQAEQRDLKNSTLDLQYDVRSRPKYRTTFDAGIRTDFPLQLHYNLRFRYVLPLENDYVFRFTETVYWREWEGYGETSRFDLEKLLSAQTLARTSLSATFSEISRGVDLSANTGLSHKLSPKAGISGDLVTNASTRPNTSVSSYGIVTRYRRNYFRKWLFFEIIPQIMWERDDNDNFEGITAITFRFDVQFWQH